MDLHEAAAQASHKGKTYYHGTTTEAAAESIMSNGLIPPDMTGKKDTMLKPVDGKVYITPDISYALIYAIGGNIVGSTVPESFVNKEGRYGYVFLVDGNDLQDIQPDEDAIGEFLASDKCPEWLDRRSKAILGPSTYRRAKEGDYCWGARAGKTMLRHMTDAEKLDLIDRGTAIAHHGNLMPFAAWKVDKLRCQDLKKDGSNVSEVCEYIDLR